MDSQHGEDSVSTRRVKEHYAPAGAPGRGQEASELATSVCVRETEGETDLKVSLGNFGSNGNILYFVWGER